MSDKRETLAHQIECVMEDWKQHGHRDRMAYANRIASLLPTSPSEAGLKIIEKGLLEAMHYLNSDYEEKDDEMTADVACARSAVIDAISALAARPAGEAPLKPGTCPECRGTGTWGETSDCSECKGTGNRPAEEKGVCRTSAEWALRHQEFTILDPDGWDRSPEGFEWSWTEEITEAEFMRRVNLSTLEYNPTPAQTMSVMRRSRFFPNPPPPRVRR
jgi:hypothetical protein